MFDDLYKNVKLTKPMVELTEEVEEKLKGTRLEPGKWVLGVRRNENIWRPVLVADVLEYDIALPHSFTEKNDALNYITKLAQGFLKPEKD